VEHLLDVTVWFQIGEGMEGKLMNVLQQHNPHILAVDLSEGIPLIEEHSCHDHVHSDEGKDRHIWLSPRLAEVQARTIAKALVATYPEHQEQFVMGLNELINELQTLDAQIAQKLEPFKGQAILVSHPAFGYFCQEFGLKQISIESEGKDPLPRHIEHILQEAIALGVRDVFTQVQYNNKAALLLGKQLEIPVHDVDPYAPDYIPNLLHITQLISHEKNEAILLQNVDFSYDNTQILEKVNLSISIGELIGIFGPNGGGKTTFLKLLMGFLKPSQGSIEILGKSPKEARRDIGYVPQSTHIDKQFPISVLEVVLGGALSLIPTWVLPEKSERASRRSPCKSGTDRLQASTFWHSFWGQAQRVLIARSIISRPKILLLDEPTASIDPEAEQEIYDLILQLKQSMTILMVTHDLQIVVNMVERLLSIKRTVSSCAPEDVCGHFAMGLYHTPIKKV
jgi:zinc transport system ATP-binding protein